jgi:hypothetical protein
MIRKETELNEKRGEIEQNRSEREKLKIPT